MTKYTINIPDEISRLAKARAALEGKSLSDVIRERLAEYGAGLDVLEEADDLRLVQQIEARLSAGEEPLYSHEEVWSEIDDMDAHGELPA